MIFLNKYHIFEYGQNKRGSLKILFLTNNNCQVLLKLERLNTYIKIKGVQIKLELEKKSQMLQGTVFF